MVWITEGKRSGLSAPMSAEGMRPPPGALLYHPPAEASSAPEESDRSRVKTVTSGAHEDLVRVSVALEELRRVEVGRTLGRRRRAG